MAATGRVMTSIIKYMSILRRSDHTFVTEGPAAEEDSKNFRGAQSDYPS